MKIERVKGDTYLLTLTEDEILMLDAGISQIVCEDPHLGQGIVDFYDLEWRRKLRDIGVWIED